MVLIGNNSYICQRKYTSAAKSAGYSQQDHRYRRRRGYTSIYRKSQKIMLIELLWTTHWFAYSSEATPDWASDRAKCQQLRSQGILKDGQHRMLQHHTILQQPNANVLRRTAVQNLRWLPKKTFTLIDILDCHVEVPESKDISDILKASAIQNHEIKSQSQKGGPVAAGYRWNTARPAPELSMPQLVVSHGLTPSEKGWSTGIMIPNMAEKGKTLI